ncbi:MAG: multidrug efflux SMR transporter [Bacteroides sp.]|nr:multidrug efflux SMR transporter [Bacteroides sp.]MCM1095003.1 multidrug efflux SMR transporter [Terasakiella sp.]
MSWIYLTLAGLMEVGFTFCLGKTKAAEGASQYWWWGGFVAALTLSMLLMAKASRTIPIGTVYPVWTGIGAVGAVLVGIFFFGEPSSARRIFFITTLILSIIGLKWDSII